MIFKDEGMGTSVEKTEETTKLVSNCINYLITQEKILKITQDSEIKSERLLSLNYYVEPKDL